MTQVAQIMARGVRTLAPTDSLVIAAQTMDELNIGAIPVYDGDPLIGMITDRDITVRGVAQGRPLNDTPLGEVMSQNVRWCSPGTPSTRKPSGRRGTQAGRQQEVAQ